MLGCSTVQYDYLTLSRIYIYLPQALNINTYPFHLYVPAKNKDLYVSVK